MHTHYIIGGSKGMGLETAKKLVARGESVTLVARGEHELKTAKSKLNALGEVELQTIPCDI